MIMRVRDANGNGKLDAGWVDAKAKTDPSKDQELDPGQAYSVIPNPVDGSVWISYSVIPGGIMRYDPKTKLSEWYEPPYMNKNAKVQGYLPHGIENARIAINLSETGDSIEAAARLFTALRELDASGARTIAIMPIPDFGLGEAINDRLRRAATR